MAKPEDEVEAAMARVMERAIILGRAVEKLERSTKMSLGDVCIMLRLARNRRLQRMGPTMRGQVELIEAKLDMVTLGDSPYAVAKKGETRLLKPDGYTKWSM